MSDIFATLQEEIQAKGSIKVLGKTFNEVMDGKVITLINDKEKLSLCKHWANQLLVDQGIKH
ncbi:hypothetical protein N9R79_07620 [Vibrio sp.]|nr:hypothetical protein [Vibrio sp.]